MKRRERERFERKRGGRERERGRTVPYNRDIVLGI